MAGDVADQGVVAGLQLEGTGDRETGVKLLGLADLLAGPHAVRGLGILSMRERIAHLGGTLRIESAPGQGTRVRAEVPLAGEGDTRS